MRAQSFEFSPPAFVDLAGFRIAYREWGRPEASQTLVLIHGITSSSLSWTRVARALAEEYRVIAMDLKGHGDSDQPEDGYRLADQAREVADLCAALGLGRVSVIGHSWGGAIALLLATSTNLVERLVLEDPAIGLTNQDPRERAATGDRYAGMMELDREEANRQARSNLVLGWTEEDVAGKVDAAMRGSRDAVRAVFQVNRPWDLHALLPALVCPTLLLRAAVNNGGIVDDEAVALAATNPHISSVLVRGADHNIHRGRFDDFMAHTLQFLRGA